ncbi:MAG: class I SAM-dependent methyltransferase [Chloroflexi bacterium]|nr:class I SAM-dependent methyltransferase [Chloroflexota bacterium]MCI0645872.1 class I SAM-dependent methyltransferase [Chloroflexota bacterium]MCI0725727.1 class I SAM-dependent methyltransferase [Chloroflexota bacterium]
MNRRLKRYRRWWRNNLVEPVRQLGLGNFRRYLGDRLILRFKIRPVKSIEGWLTPAEAAALYRTAASLPPGCTVVEIGSWKGKSTFCLARGLPPGGRVIAIDPFDASGESGSSEVYQRRKGDQSLYLQFQEKMRRLGVDGCVEAWQGYSHEFVGRLPAMDFLFIDGDHSREGCEFDFLNYAPCLASGGYLGFHDYHPGRGETWGPNWVIQHRVLPSGDFEFASVFDSLWLARKKR